MTDDQRHDESASKEPSDLEVSLEDAMSDPAGCFADPAAVLVAKGMSDEDRLRVLECWEYDAREMAVASEEGMSGGEPTALRPVLAALAELRARIGEDDPDDPPTKH